VHIILKYPYGEGDYFFYSREGERLEYEVVWCNLKKISLKHFQNLFLN
jgi:hypothetical protein